jgi:hypothetical protein
MQAPSSEQASAWLPFLREVGMPYILVLLLLGLFVLGVRYLGTFLTKMLAEMRAIVVALTELRDKSKELSDRITPLSVRTVRGTPPETPAVTKEPK